MVIQVCIASSVSEHGRFYMVLVLGLVLSGWQHDTYEVKIKQKADMEDMMLVIPKIDKQKDAMITKFRYS